MLENFLEQFYHENLLQVSYKNIWAARWQSVPGHAGLAQLNRLESHNPNFAKVD